MNLHNEQETEMRNGCAECVRLKEINSDLLEACKAAERLMCYLHWDIAGRTEKVEMVERLRAAIAKAEGQTK